MPDKEDRARGNSQIMALIFVITVGCILWQVLAVKEEVEILNQKMDRIIKVNGIAWDH